MSCVNCNNNQAETNNNYIPDPCETGCLDIVKGNCATYSGTTTSCLGITSGTTVDNVIKAIDTAICLLSEDRYADYNYSCLSGLQITTEQTFAEKIAMVICNILGSESATSPVSLSTLKVSVADIEAFMAAVGLETCYAGVPGTTSTLSALLTDIQNKICNLNTDFNALDTQISILTGKSTKVKVSATDTTPNYLLNKIVPATGISIGQLNVGSDEHLQIGLNPANMFSVFLAYLNSNPSASASLIAMLSTTTTTTTAP